MAYFTFGDPALVQEGAELWGALREGGVTVGDLYRSVGRLFRGRGLIFSPQGRV